MEAAAIQSLGNIGSGFVPTVPLFFKASVPAGAKRMKETQRELRAAEDREFVERILGNGGEAYGELVERYKVKVLGTAARFARNAHDLDDLAQDIFLRVWRGLEKYRGDAPLEHWVMRVAVRTCYDFLRRNRRRRESEVLVEDPDRQSRDEASVAVARRREAWEIVQAGMRKLGAKERMVLTLLELEDKSVAEVADLTGWSTSNVKVRAFRARKKLREAVEREGYGYE